jgi:NitT/TauT family transport system substrate-binding protein
LRTALRLEVSYVELLTRSQLLAGTGAVALACGPLPLRAQAPPHIRVAGVATDDMTPIYWAVKSGIYQKAGLDVEIVPVSSGTAATTAVIAGAYEIGKGSPIASMLAHLRGLPLVVIANASMWDPKNPFNLTVVAADSTIKTGADLNGKIAASPALNDMNALSIMAWVDKNGGDSKTLKYVELTNSATAAALHEHRVDVAAMVQPQVSDAIADGTVRVLAECFNAIADRFVIANYFANSDWVAKNSDVVKRWVRVTLAAGAYTNTHHNDTVAMMSGVTQIPIDVFRKMVRVEATTPDTADPALVQPLVDVAARYKNIPRGFPAREMFLAG